MGPVPPTLIGTGGTGPGRLDVPRMAWLGRRCGGCVRSPEPLEGGDEVRGTTGTALPASRAARVTAAMAILSDGSTEATTDVTWMSDALGVATVSPSGLMTARRGGGGDDFRGSGRRLRRLSQDSRLSRVPGELGWRRDCDRVHDDGGFSLEPALRWLPGRRPRRTARGGDA